MSTPATLRQRASELETEAQTLITSIAEENRDVSEIEQSEIDRRLSEADRMTRQAEAIEAINLRLQSRARPEGRISSPTIEAGESEDDKKFRTGGFRSSAHFFSSIVRGQPATAAPEDAQALIQWRSLSKRVTEAQKRSIQGLNVSSGPDGGDLVPPEYANAIWDKSRSENDVVKLVNFVPIQGNTWRRPGVAETSRATGSRYGGIRAYWEGEGDDGATSRPTFNANELRLKKLMCIVPLTSEMMEDVPQMESWVNTNVPLELGFTLQDAFINGDGVAKPKGITGAACAVSVAKESGQAAATVVGQNITKMWSRLYGPSRKNAVWLYNQDVEPQLDQLYFSTGSNSGQLIYTPAGGLSGGPYATLKGRPMIPVEQCQTLGTVGDLILVDPTQIDAIRKSSGDRADVSIHVYFLSDQSVMRFVSRVDMQPSWASALTPFKGSNTLSPIITLATRS